jgi:hypothetical protein
MSATSSDNTNTRSDETKQVEYVLDERFDLLVKTFLKQRIPDIHVKKEYVDTIQIAWPRYLGLHLMPKAMFIIKDVFENTITPHVMYMLMKYYMKPEEFEDAMIKLGHVPEMYTFNTSLQGRMLGVFLPFFYSYANHQAFELYMIKNLEHVIHRFELRPLSKLLRMRRTDDGGKTWKDIMFDAKYITVDNGGDDDKVAKYLPTPTLKGMCAVLESCEKKEKHCEIKESPKFQMIKFIDEFMVVPAKQECRPGRGGSVDVETSHLPCKGIGFFCMNCDAIKYNNHGNYTTNLEDPTQGTWPITHYSLSYKNMERIIETDMFDYEMREMKLMPYRNIKESGLGLLLTSFDVQLGELCSTNDYDDLNATLFIKLAEDPDERKAYNFFVILWCTKKMIYTQLPVDSDSSETYYAIRVDNPEK